MGALQKIVDDHREKFDNCEVTNYLDAYFEHQKEHKDGYTTFTGELILR